MVEGKRPPGERVVVYDCDGYFMGASLAELLALEGYRVTLATPYEQVAPLCSETLEAYGLRRRLHEIGVSMATGTTVTALEPGRTLGQDMFEDPVTFETNAVALVTQRVSDDTLYAELATEPAQSLRMAGIEGVYRIGDCLSLRLLGDVIFDGHRLAREIDSPDPSVPLPYLRERPLVTAAAASLAPWRAPTAAELLLARHPSTCAAARFGLGDRLAAEDLQTRATSYASRAAVSATSRSISTPAAASPSSTAASAVVMSSMSNQPMWPIRKTLPFHSPWPPIS